MGISGKKRTIAAAAAGACALVAALFVLLYFSNRVIRSGLERALGGRCTIERISLGWNGVEAVGVRLLKGGRPFFTAKRVDMRASFLTLLGTRYAVSRISIEGASLTLSLDGAGKVENPMDSPADPRPAGRTYAGKPVYIGRVSVRDGSVTVRDGGPKGGEAVRLTGINIDADGVTLPLAGAPFPVSLSAHVDSTPFSGNVRCSGTVDPATLAGRLTVEAADVEAFRDAQGPGARARSVRFTAASAGESGAGRELALSDVVLMKPFIRIEEDRAGRLKGTPSPGRPTRRQGGDRGAFRLDLKRVTVADGEVLFLDGKVARTAYPVRLTGIDLSADSLSFPAEDGWTSWRIRARVEGKPQAGILTASGRTNIGSLDTKGRIDLRGLGLVTLQPYLRQKGEAQVTGGTLDMDMDVGIRARSVHAPTHVVIRGLRLASGGMGDRFLGVPRRLVLRLLETSKDEIPLDFIVEGSIDDPRFNLRENLVRRFSVSIGRKVGVNVLGTGEAAVTQGGRLLKGLGRGIRNLFR